MASLVVLVVDLIRIFFENSKITESQQFAAFIFIPEVFANSTTFNTSLSSANHTQLILISSPSTIKHDLGHGSHINLPAGQSTDKRSRFLFISVLLSHLSLPNKQPIPISVNTSMPSVYLHIDTITDDEK